MHLLPSPCPPTGYLHNSAASPYSQTKGYTAQTVMLVESNHAFRIGGIMYSRQAYMQDVFQPNMLRSIPFSSSRNSPQGQDPSA